MKKLSQDTDRTYKCGGFRRYHCTSVVKFVKPAETDICCVYESGEHFHYAPDSKISGIPQHVKHTLLEGLENCTKPAKVYRKLSKTLPKPIYNDISLKQVQQAMGYLKKNVCSVLEQNTIGFLYEWLQTHELGLDSDIHTAGILPGWVCQGSSNLEGTEANVQFVLTTKRLLCNLVKQAECTFGQFLSIDNTYGLLAVGYPITQVGTVDAAHKYHHVGVAVTRHEDAASFTLTVDSIKLGVFAFFGFQMQPRCSVPDKAKAIYNALTSVFPAEMGYLGISVAICYFHNKQAIETNKARFSTEARRQAFESDIEKLHSITSTEVFKNAMTLFEKKWTRKEKDATSWYMEEWGHTFFHAGATPVGAPVANCMTERNNRSIKDYVTNHERLAMGNFLGGAIEELVFQSNEEDKYPLSIAVTNDRQSWGYAQLWLKDTKKFIKESTSAHSKCFYAPSSSFLEHNANPLLQDLRNAIWQCKQPNLFDGEKFDDYVERTSQVHTFKLIESKNGENFFSCTCSYYWKYATCKHSLGLSIWKQKVSVPVPYLVDSLEQLKKRGRPKKVKNFMQKV